VEGADPLAPYPVRAAADLRRLGGLETCGDLVLISSVHPDGQVHAFESLVGSHGGLGGEQNRAVLLHPGQWRIEESLLEPVGDERMIVGGWNVHEQLLRWRSSLTEPASGGLP
jgi:hypothetical protein